LEGISFTKSAGFKKELYDFIMATKTSLGEWLLVGVLLIHGSRWEYRTHQDERSRIKCIPGVDVDSSRDQFLTHFQVAPPTSLAEYFEIICEVEGTVLFQPSL
jgi:hypothetical protein